jgi:glycosyl transferase, family 25
MSMQNFSALLLNLDRDEKRLSHMQKQLARANVYFSRQSGILSDNIPEDLKRYFFDEMGNAKTNMKRGEVGCYASHLRALKRVASGELGHVTLIMEDDLEIAPDLLDVIFKAQNAMPATWDILRLSSPSRRAYMPIAQVGLKNFLVRYSKIPNSAGAYLVTSTGAQKFLDQGVRGLTFDDDLRRPWFHGMETYGVMPPPIRAGVLESTIDAIEAGRFNKGMSSRMERILRGDHFYMIKRLRYNIQEMGMKGWAACTAINILDMFLKPIMGQSIIDRAAKSFSLKR